MSFTILILWLHLLGVVIWVGGLVFQLLVLAPVLKPATASVEQLRFAIHLDVRFRYVMWPAVGLVLLTGLYNVMNVLLATTLAGATPVPSFVRLLGVKLLLVSLMIVLQALQRFAVHPRLVTLLRHQLAESTEHPGDRRNILRRSRLLNMLTVALAFAAMLLGLLLRG